LRSIFYSHDTFSYYACEELKGNKTRQRIKTRNYLLTKSKERKDYMDIYAGVVVGYMQ
jgi:hypothetical protein